MSDSCDVVVVGGGIHGALIAYKIAQAGLNVILLERDDFCGACSANSLKIIHGGLRYLQHLDLARIRASIFSRREMMCFSPHLVRPFSSVMPVYGHGIKGSEATRIALFLYDLLGFDRNKGLPPSSRIPGGEFWSPAETEANIPGVNGIGLRGAMVWQDAFVENSERLVLEYIKAAESHGASCLNYHELLEVQSAQDQVEAVSFLDRMNNTKKTIRTRCVINAAGSWWEKVVPEGSRGTGSRKWTRALNIVVKKSLFSNIGVALEGKEKQRDRDSLVKSGQRMLFFVPWRRKYTMIGTHYKAFNPVDPLLPVERGDIAAMVREVNEIYPEAGIVWDDVSFYHCGLLPVAAGSNDDTVLEQPAKSSELINHGGTGGPQGLYSISGVKYTTAPYVAKKILDMLSTDMKFPGIISGTSASAEGCRGVEISKLPEGSIDRYLAGKYGCYYPQVKSYVSEDDRCLSHMPLLWSGEVRYFVEQEKAMTLADVVFRRSELGSAECPAYKTLLEVAECMSELLGWDDETVKLEIEKVLLRYKPLGGAGL